MSPSSRLPLTPRLGPRPAGMPGVAALLLLCAIVLLAPASLHPGALFSGSDVYPDGQGTFWHHWLFHTEGLLGESHTRLQMYPHVVDEVVLGGFPLDAMASWPFALIFGWPRGYGIFQVASLWGAGLAMAWLAGRWWRSPAAALIAGVAYEASAPLLRELAYGRSTQVFGAIFVPLALGWFARAVVEGRPRDAMLAGLASAGCALAYWYHGLFCVLGLLVIAALAWWEGLPAPRTLLLTLGTLGIVCLLPAAYTFGQLGQVGGVRTTLYSTIHFGEFDMRLVDLLEERDLTSTLNEGSAGLLPVLYGLAVLGILRERPRRWLAPLVWTLGGGLLALGPVLAWVGPLPLPGPFGLFSLVPVLRRMWWPDRALLLVAPGIALLAGGGAAHLLSRLPVGGAIQRRVPALLAPTLLAASLLVEAWLVLPTLPMPTTSAVPSARAEAIAQGTGPLLVLPQPIGPYLLGSTIRLDQVFHRRPLVNGLMPPGDATAPASYRDFSMFPAMAHLYGCAVTPTPFTSDAAAAILPLRRLGITEVVVDVEMLTAAEADVDRYVSCVTSVLGPPVEDRGPYRVWGLPPALP